MTETRRHLRFTTLLAILLANFLILPVIVGVNAPDDGGVHSRLGQIGLGIVIVAVVIIVVRGRRARIAVAGVAVPGIAAGIWRDMAPGLPVAIVHQASVGALFFLIVVLLMRHVLQTKEITGDTIAAALCAYLVVGVAWASVYAVVDLVEPGSFSIPDDGLGPFAAVVDGPDASLRRIYFSLVTLLTLGYGEIVPTSSVARLSAVMEAFVGQVFLVVIVAWLVGIYISQQVSGRARGT